MDCDGNIISDGGHKATLLVNCVPNCIKCRAMENAVTGGFLVWADDMGFNVVLCDESRKSLGNWRRYGTQVGLTRATPQLYLVTGQDVKGVTVVVGKVVNGYRIPDLDRWNADMLKSLVRALMSNKGECHEN